jgi:hypothetical protein
VRARGRGICREFVFPFCFLLRGKHGMVTFCWVGIDVEALSGVVGAESGWGLGERSGELMGWTEVRRFSGRAKWMAC